MKLDGRLGSIETKLEALQRSHDETIICMQNRWHTVEAKLDMMVERTQSADGDSSEQSSSDGDRETLHASSFGAQFFDISKSPNLFRVQCTGCGKPLSGPIIVPEPVEILRDVQALMVQSSLISDKLDLKCAPVPETDLSYHIMLLKEQLDSINESCLEQLELMKQATKMTSAVSDQITQHDQRIIDAFSEQHAGYDDFQTMLLQVTSTPKRVESMQTTPS